MTNLPFSAQTKSTRSFLQDKGHFQEGEIEHVEIQQWSLLRVAPTPFVYLNQFRVATGVPGASGDVAAVAAGIFKEELDVTKSASAKRRAAADAQRVRRAKEAAEKRQEAKNRNLRPHKIHGWEGIVVPAPGSDDDPDLPEIHAALGRWPENSVPNILWDLANPVSWTYKRPLTEQELESSPFEPSQKKMTILLCPEKGWTIDVKPRANHRFMTLRCFQESITTAMKQEVSSALWWSANIDKKFAIVLAYYRRTGNLPIIPSVDIFAEWRKYLNEYSNNPEAVHNIVAQMDSYVTRGASRSMTKLQTIDLLGPNTMFAGLTYLKEMDLWVMSTTSRHNASMAHHLLPRPNTAPIAPRPVLQAGAPTTVPNTAPYPVPMMRAPMMQAVARPPVPPMVPQMVPQMPAQSFQNIPQCMLQPFARPAHPMMANMAPQYVWYDYHMHRFA
ncbi:hypothetical protein A7U60_g3775 [Sanghuangporus baumii]|uniref:DUF6699 domain-containing protein n=1 Tax=Sanghuangporus baumii TaxID=108892 RepID=A0A9Q5I036_SANBA|nr:hypothetical protein A7U60_g3775 [Sanghuangporus baumii]